jgi:chromosome segregation ATPase
MDLRSEIEQHAHLMKSKVASQLQDIHQIQDTVVLLEDRISVLQDEINSINQSLEPDIRELAAKIELIAQWQSALAEHKNRLSAKQMLIAAHAAIENNHARIEKSLAELAEKQASVSDSITQFHKAHPDISSNIEERLHRELQTKKSELASISNKIAHLETIQKKLNVIVKFFLDLLQSLGWLADPLAVEQEKLQGITTDIAQITQTLNEYSARQQEITELRDKNELISTETEKLIQDKVQLQQIEDTKRAISESQQTIKQLNSQINETSSNCSAIKKRIEDKKLNQKLTAQQLLVEEKNKKKALVQEKSQQLADIDSPKRAALKTVLNDALLDIATHQTQYLQAKEGFKSAHPNTQFFKPTTTTSGTRDIPNYIALARIRQAIENFQTGLESTSQEYRLLSQITTKLLLWQIAAESSTTANLSMQERNSAHQDLNTEIAKLITALPIDNPIHAIQHYIATLTLPLEAVEHHTNSRTKKNRK